MKIKENTRENTKEKKNKTLIIVIIVVIILSLLIAAFAIFYNNGGDKVLPFNLTMDEGQKNIHNEESSEGNIQYTKFPGLSTIKLTDKTNFVQLSNPEGNTVNFVYTITKTVKENVIWESTFTESNKEGIFKKAQKEVDNNKKLYKNVKEGDKYLFEINGKKTNTSMDYKVVTKDDKIQVVAKELEMLYFTGGISPGKSVDWKIKNFVKENTSLNIQINTYDTETNKQCIGTNLIANVVFV